MWGVFLCVFRVRGRELSSMSVNDMSRLWDSCFFDLEAFFPNNNLAPFGQSSSPELPIQGSCSFGAVKAENAVCGDSASLGSNTESDREAQMLRSLSGLSVDHILCSSWPGKRGCLTTNELLDEQSICHHPHRYGARAMKKASSTGDLHFDSGSENSIAEQGQVTVMRYSAEERKERVRRYQSKRAKRNFKRKIEYECRKVLADGRRRIRGRFARNEGAEKNIQEAIKSQKGDDMRVELLQEDKIKFITQIANDGLGNVVTPNYVSY